MAKTPKQEGVADFFFHPCSAGDIYKGRENRAHFFPVTLGLVEILVLNKSDSYLLLLSGRLLAFPAYPCD